jgi:hypothetical protein
MFLEIMKREGLFLHVFKRRRMCVCAGEWEKHGRYFFFLAFLGRKGLSREKGVVGVTCFVTFLFVFGGL